MAKLKSGTRVYGDAQVDQTLTVGNITISGNLTVNGTTTTIDTTTTRVEDPIFELGGGAAGAALTTNDGQERGLLMHYYNGSAIDAYMGWHTSNGQFEFGANATETSGNIVINTYGNVKANHFKGEGDTLANITGANVTGWVAQANYANYVGQVIDATQSNITLLGTQTSLTVSGTSNISTLNSNGVVNFTNSTVSTSTTSGALVVAGGVGIGGNLWVGGTLHADIQGTTSAPGANTDVVFNDNGTSNATGGFTFDKTTNTVSTTDLVLGGKANIGADLNMTAATANITGANLIANVTTELLLKGGTSNISLTTGNAVIATAGGTATVNNDGNLTLSAGALKVNSNAVIYASGSANVANLIATGSGSAGTANVGSVIARDIAENQIPYADGDSRLKGSSAFKYTSISGLLEVGNATLTGTANAANVVVTSLSDTRIPFANSGKALVDSANLTFNSTSKTLSVDNVTMSGTANAAEVIITSLTGTRVPFVDSTDKSLTDSSTFTYTSISDTLAVGNVTMTGTANAAEVIVTSLTSTRIPYVDTDKSLTDTSTFTYTSISDKVKVGNLELTGTANAAEVIVTSLTATRIPFVDSDKSLTDSANITFSNDVLTVTGNVAATNIKTDNLLYANGVAWDLQQAAGDTGEIQFNNGDNFAASANLSFNTTGNILTTDNLALNVNANIAGNVIAANLRSNALTAGRVTFATTDGLLTDSSSLTFGSGNLGVAGNIVMSGGANVTGVSLLSATTANVTDMNATGNATIGGWANITGNLFAGNTVITGNLTVTGTTTSVNTTVSQLTDPLIDLGGGANGAALSTNDAYDRGLVMHTRTSGTNKDLFMGWDASTTQFILAKNVSVTDNVVDYGTTAGEIAANLADLKLSNIYAYNANFGGVVFSEGNVTLGSGKFIGDLQGNVFGNISGNIKVAGANGSIQFATNVTEHVGTAVTAGSFEIGKLYQIVTAGTTSFTAIGAANNNVGTQFTATGVGSGTGTAGLVSTYGDLANDGSNLIYVGGNLSVALGSGGYVKTDYLTGTLTTAAQPNITSVGTLTGLDVSGGNVSIANGGSSHYGIKTDYLYYSNGDAWDLQQASGVNNYIQYNIDGNFSSSSKFTFDPTSNVFTVDGNANVSSNLFTQTATVSSLTSTRVVYAGTDGKLVDNSAFTFASGTLSVGNVTMTGTANAAEVVVTSLTSTRVPFVDTDKSLTDDSSFTFGSSTLTVPNVTMSGTANAAEVIVTSLSATRVPFVDADKSLTDSANLTFASNELKVTGNANVTNTITTADIVVSNLTGGRVTFAEVTTDKLTDSAQFTFDASSNTLTTITANVTTLNGTTANISGNVFGANVWANSGTVKATTLIGTLDSTSNNQSNINTIGTLTSLTVGGKSHLGPIANVEITGGTAGQVIVTDGAGNLSFATNDTSRIVNGTSNVSIPSADGNINMVAGGTTIVEVSGTGANVTGVVNVTGNIQGNNITALATITANSTADASNAAVGSAIHTKGGISAEGNIYAGKAVGFAVGSGNTDSAAYIQFNSTSGSLDFIFN